MAERLSFAITWCRTVENLTEAQSIAAGLLNEQGIEGDPDEFGLFHGPAGLEMIDALAETCPDPAAALMFVDTAKAIREHGGYGVIAIKRTTDDEENAHAEGS